MYNSSKNPTNLRLALLGLAVSLCAAAPLVARAQAGGDTVDRAVNQTTRTAATGLYRQYPAGKTPDGLLTIAALATTILAGSMLRPHRHR